MLNGVSHEVLGVMPESFAHPEDAEFWVPLAPVGQFEQLFSSRGSYWLTIIGRLKPGVAREAAQSEMDAIAARLEKEYPANAGIGIRLVPMHEEIVGDVKRPLIILLGAVCFVLLIACANVANLLLTRAASRQRELAIRAALGAGRRRLLRQMLTESLLLGLIGGAAGLLVAAWCTRASSNPGAGGPPAAREHRRRPAGDRVCPWRVAAHRPALRHRSGTPRRAPRLRRAPEGRGPHWIGRGSRPPGPRRLWQSESWRSPSCCWSAPVCWCAASSR